jgi:DtxR family Mn-dependent transcriptional regulator
VYSQTEENYIKAIYKLSHQLQGNVTTNAIAEMLQTKAASVTDMIRKLSAKKIVNYEKYRGVVLTEKGKHIAVSVVRKHRLWEVFLFEKLNFGWDEVHEIAEQLEHIHSELLTDKLDEFLGYPKVDPHGDVIPGKNGEMKPLPLHLLAECKTGDTLVLSGVVDHSPLFLQYLDKLGLRLGVLVEVEEVEEYDGSIIGRISGSKTPVLLSKDVARQILVKRKKGK